MRTPDFLFYFITNYTNFRLRVPLPNAQDEMGAGEHPSEFILRGQCSELLEGNDFIYLYLYLPIYVSIINLCIYVSTIYYYVSIYVSSIYVLYHVSIYVFITYQSCTYVAMF